MKTRSLFALTAFALSLSLTACDSYEPVAAGTEVQSGDKACRIESFVLTLTDGSQLRGDVYDYDKTIDIGYDFTNERFLDGARAAYTLSEGATISPDPSTAADYSQAIAFTVTAPDGVTKRIYKTNPNERVVETYLKVTALANKTGADAGNGTGAFGQVGVSGGNVVVGTKVLNGKTLASVGDLNVTGIEGKVAWLSNDEKGRLVGAFTPGGAIDAAPTELVIWKDGYNNDPTLIVKSNSAYGLFLSVSGDLVEGSGILTSEVKNSPEGAHQYLQFTDGVYAWAQLKTGKPSDDPAWSYQQVSACSGDPLGTWFMYDAIAGSSTVYTWNNWTSPTVFQLTELKDVIADGGASGWGGFHPGSIRAFSFGGEPYAIALTRNWSYTNFTIVDPEGKLIYNETIPYGSGGGYWPVASYIYNEEEGAGYIYIHFPADLDPQAVHVWRIEEAAL